MVAAEGPEGLSGSAAALNGSTASETASTLTYTDGEPLNSRPTESSASLGRPREAASRRLSENLMCYARASQQAPRGSPEAAKAAATTATSSRSLRTANGTEAPHAASPFESFAVPKSQRAEGKEAELTSHTSRTAASSTRQSRSVQERSASRRGASAISRPQAKLEPPAVAGPGKSKDAENAKVGFAKRSERERMGPSSCFLSATRTRESLLVPGEGRAYHLGVQHGELHSRILTVGHAGRADWLAERFLDSQMRTLSLKSNRNFRLHSGEPNQTQRVWLHATWGALCGVLVEGRLCCLVPLRCRPKQWSLVQAQARAGAAGSVQCPEVRRTLTEPTFCFVPV